MTHYALKCYRFATAAASPLLPFYLRARARKGKEESARLRERFGHASLPRPEGRLLWLHAASVGEANSVQPLIEALTHLRPGWRILLTTGTVTSARLMRQRLPQTVMHQFAPLDTPCAARRFIRHWRPDVALMVESELWPNLLEETHRSGTRLLLINARISGRSFTSWRRVKPVVAEVLGCFDAIFAQSDEDAARYRALGANLVECLGNLKYDAAPLVAEANALAELERQAAGRPRWLAASIHPGEEGAVAQAHAALKPYFPKLLTLVVPRHPPKASAMAEVFSAAGLNVVLRSTGQEITRQTDVYIADTLGELGLFYRASRIAFVGGSLISHGGQNPLEPARLSCAILLGPYMFNFIDVAESLVRADAAICVQDAGELTKALHELLMDAARVSGMAARASAHVIGKGGVNERLLARLLPMLEQQPWSNDNCVVSIPSHNLCDA